MVDRKRGRTHKMVKDEAKPPDDGGGNPPCVQPVDFKDQLKPQRECNWSSSPPPDHTYASEEARRYMLERAEELRKQLDPTLPSFAKTMRPSHVYATFWVSLPNRFCCEHLPKEDSKMILVDESAAEFPSVYLAKRTGLSGGWRLFATSHSLQDGDALVFQLTGPTTLKVYILRSDDYTAAAIANELCAKSSTNGSKVSPEGEADCGGCLRRQSDSKGRTGCCFQCFELKERMRRKALEVEEVERENEELRVANSCKVCMEVDLSILLLPCKHLCLCAKCEPKLPICPICNTAKISSVQVFMY